MQKMFEVRSHLATSTEIAPSTSPWWRHALVCPCSWALSSSKDIPAVYFVLPGKPDLVISWYSQPNQLICQFCGNINWTIVVNLLTLTDHRNKKNTILITYKLSVQPHAGADFQESNTNRQCIHWTCVYISGQAVTEWNMGMKMWSLHCLRVTHKYWCNVASSFVVTNNGENPGYLV
jgi:hypothetical protein